MSKAKRKIKDRVISIASNGDAILGPTKERLAHYADEQGKFKTETGRTTTRLSPVDSLYDQNDISDDGYSAAATYQHDYNFAVSSQSVTMDLSKDIVDCSGGADIFNGRRMDAVKRLAMANAKLSPRERKAMEQIICGDLSLTQFGIGYLGCDPESRNAASKAKDVLKRTLNILAKHYNAAMPRQYARKVA